MRSIPAKSNSSTSGSTRVEVTLMTSAMSRVARLTTNSPVAMAFEALCFSPSLAKPTTGEGRRPI